MNRKKATQEHRFSTRRGISMIEMMVCVTLSVFVLSTASTLLHKMFTHQQLAKADARFHQTAGRLSNQFRRDVRDCVRCTAGENPNGLSLAGEDGATVVYSVDEMQPSLVHRKRTSSDAQTGAVHVDQFLLPASSTVTFRIDDDGETGDGIARSSIAQLRIELPDPTLAFHTDKRVSATSAEPAHELVIEAFTNANGHKPYKPNIDAASQEPSQ